MAAAATRPRYQGKVPVQSYRAESWLKPRYAGDRSKSPETKGAQAENRGSVMLWQPGLGICAGTNGKQRTSDLFPCPSFGSARTVPEIRNRDGERGQRIGSGPGKTKKCAPGRHLQHVADMEGGNERKLCEWQGWLGGAETPKPHPGTLPSNHQSSNATYQPKDDA